MNEKELENLVIAYLTEKLVVLKIARSIFSPGGLDCNDLNTSIFHLEAVLVMLREKKVQDDQKDEEKEIMAKGVPIKEIVGIQEFVSKSTGKKGYNIYLVEPFPDDSEGITGVKTSSEFTYDDWALKVGDKVKIYKDVIESSKGSFPVIQEIVKVNPVK